jgi:hypothetical protein
MFRRRPEAFRKISVNDTFPMEYAALAAGSARLECFGRTLDLYECNSRKVKFASDYVSLPSPPSFFPPPSSSPPSLLSSLPLLLSFSFSSPLQSPLFLPAHSLLMSLLSVLLGPFGSSWVLLGPFGSFWVLLGPFGSFWVLLGPPGPFGSS